jgi:hypothetical protein
MFNLEQAILAWRRQMWAAGIKDPCVVDELESHLREDIRAFVSAGKSEAEAFQLAVLLLGNAGPLRTEFNKLKKPSCRPVTIAWWLYAGAMILMAVLLTRRVGSGSWDLLLYAHVVSVTAGYCAAFFAGCFGIFYVCCRLARSVDRQRWLRRGVFLFTHVAAGLSLAGMTLATLWSSQHPVYQIHGYVREMAALRACIWLLASCVMQRIGRVTERAIMMMCIAGNVVVGLAWFGPFILEGKIGYWPLAVFIATNLLFLMLGLASAPGEVEAH